MKRVNRLLAGIAFLALSGTAHAGFTPVKHAGVVCSDMEAAFAHAIATDLFPTRSTRENAKMISSKKSWCIVGAAHRKRPVKDTGAVAVGFDLGEGHVLSYITKRRKKMFFIEFRPWSWEA